MDAVDLDGAHIDDEACERDYQEHWREILEPQGVLDMRQLKRELADYSFVIAQVPSVYMHITGNKLSKLNYYADTVIEAANDEQERYCERCKEDENEELRLARAEIERLRQLLQAAGLEDAK